MIINPPRRQLSKSEQHNKHINTQMKAESDETPNDMTTHDYALQHPINSESDSDGHDVDSDTPDIHIPTDTNNEATESWVDWIKRTTHETEQLIQSLGIEDWVFQQRRRKWRWVQRVALDKDKWTYKAALWEPSLNPQSKAGRKQARPRRRWTDDINEHITNMSNKENINDKHNRNDNPWTIAADTATEKWKEQEEDL